MKSVSRVTGAATLFCLSLATGFATDNEDLSSRIDELEKKIAHLEDKEVPKNEGDDSALDLFGDVQNRLGVEIHGHLQFEYEDFESGGSRSGNSTFDNQYFTLWIGKKLSEDLEVAVEIEYEHGGTSGQDGGGTSGGGGGETEIDQAQATWRPLSSDTWKIRLGKFYVPFGIERFEYAGPYNRLVSRPAPFQRIYPGTYADTGVQTLGEIPFGDFSFKYELAVVNGLGPTAASSIRSSRQGRDNNDNKAFVGRIALAAQDWFEIGTSYYDGKYNSFEALGTALVPEDELRLTYSGIDAQIKLGQLDLKGEWIYSSVETGETLTNGVRNFHRDGYYIQGAYRFDIDRHLWKYTDAVVRFDSKDENSTVQDTNDTNTWALGMNWGVNDHLIVKIEKQLTHERGPVKIDNDAWLGQVSIQF